MNGIKKTIAAIMLTMAMMFVAGCKPEDTPNNGNNDSDVRVTTYTPQDITGTTAKCGGDVIVIQSRFSFFLEKFFLSLPSQKQSHD